MEKIRASNVIAYATLPRVVPRLKKLMLSGFGFLTLLVAHVYAMVRLLPDDHPYLDTKNMGRYGVRHVIIEASRNLSFSRKNIDQFIVFFAIIGAVILLLMQFVILIYGMVVGHAHAFSWFDTPDPATDVAFTLLDRVFGVPGVFCSSFTPANCTDYSGDTNLDGTAGPTIPMPFHLALHQLFRFYSQALLLIAMLIFLYFVVVIVLETAVTGTPFGQRFQNIWVPVRLVMAIGLLVPINYGLNSGQWVTLYVAKFGSSFATSAWRQYNTTIGAHSDFSGVPLRPGDVAGNPLGKAYNLLAVPQPANMQGWVQAMATVHACAYMYHRKAAGAANVATGTPENVTNYASGAVYPETSANLSTYGYTAQHAIVAQRVGAYLVKNPTEAMKAANGTTLGVSYMGDVVANSSERRVFVGSAGFAAGYGIPFNEALGFFYGSDITIRFGEYAIVRDPSGGSVPKYGNDDGNVRPLCGDIRIKSPGVPADANDKVASFRMARHYYDQTLNMWFEQPRYQQFARLYTSHYSAEEDKAHIESLCADTVLSGVATSGSGFPATAAECEKNGIGREWLFSALSDRETVATVAIREAWTRQTTDAPLNMTSDIMNLGWGGAGVWFTKVADINGEFVSAVQAIPTMDKMPIIMEEIRDKKQKAQKNSSITEKPFSPYFVSDKDTSLLNLSEEYWKEIGVPLSHVHDYFGMNADMLQPRSGNVVSNTIHMLFGTSGLVSMRTSNAHIHPLAQLSAVGRGLVESAIRNIAYASAASFTGGMLSAFETQDRKLGSGVFSAMSQVFLSIAFIGLTAGFILFYVLPILPFVYFFFALGSWVKAIFEAMVGVPLWALAHLRIDGDGLPGDAAQNGYFLLLEIFIRPILTLFGLVAALTIFAVQVYTLNTIWGLVTSNLAGFKPGTDILTMSEVFDIKFKRGPVDQFFFTVIYAIVCYMLALASFKLIDMIPDNILRWAGAGVSSYGDIDKDHVEALNRYAAMGGMTVGSQASEATVKFSGGVGSGLGRVLAGEAKKGG